MFLEFESRIEAIIKFGYGLRNVFEVLSGLCESNKLSPAEYRLYRAGLEAPLHNQWFTVKNVCEAIGALGDMLREEQLATWVEAYPELKHDVHKESKTIAVIQAGNIPLVGFHDFVCVLMAGHRFLGKLSSQDQILPVAAAGLLIEINSEFGNMIEFSGEPIRGFDGVVATGSNNSARYFEYYFGKYPHIIRKNRNSAAVITGRDTSAELTLLGSDVFTFFGLGCRNVSKLLVPVGFNPEVFREAWAEWKHVADHHKYFNNYDYFKAVYLINKQPFCDIDFCLLRREKPLGSPVSVVHYEEYSSESWLRDYLENEKDNLQCIIGNISLPNHSIIPFGTSQRPSLWDYADRIDTMKFLLADI
ncbi:MAG TPA: hypothetical protein VLH61_04510 [Bacteroidales bacterium]|nr:hypothetical protein [Bacteroidales bacterium]